MIRLKSFKPWGSHRPFRWSDTKSTGELFSGGDSADGIDQAVNFFFSGVTSATGTNYTHLRVAEPFDDSGCVEVTIRCENGILDERTRDVG